MRTIRSRVIILAAVVAASLWVIYPPKETIKLGLDLNGGVHLVLRVKTDEALQLDTQAAVEQARHTIERRVNELGVAEAVVARYTTDDQILVQLPGVTDVDRAKQIIKSTAFDGVHSFVDCDAVEPPHAPAARRLGRGRALGVSLSCQTSAFSYRPQTIIKPQLESRKPRADVHANA